MTTNRVLAGALAAGAVACGGSPTGPAPIELYTVAAIVFYDENGNGLREGNEVAVVPGAQVEIAGRVGTAQAATGRASVTGVAAGRWVASVRAASLPPFYRAGASVELTVPLPQGEELELPVTLPIGANRPGTYMAFGDSITQGSGSTDDMGYRSLLEPRLRAHFGQGGIVDASVSGSRSNAGALRVNSALRNAKPAYTIVHYGTNDWNDLRCQHEFPCFTIDSLRTIVRAVKGRESLPVLSTIIPVNTGYDSRVPESRARWVADMNELIRPLAREEGALLVDMHAAFMRTPDFHALFYDHVHPNDQGYQVMTDEFFRALTQPAGTQGASLGFEPLEPFTLGFAPGLDQPPGSSAAPALPGAGPFRRERELPGRRP